MAIICVGRGSRYLYLFLLVPGDRVDEKKRAGVYGDVEYECDDDKYVVELNVRLEFQREEKSRNL